MTELLDRTPDMTRSLTLLDAYREMHLIRQFEQTCLDLSGPPRNLIAGSIHLCAGQEAIPVGATSVLDGRDRVIATYRGHGWALSCGVTPYEMLAEVCHKADGINGGRAGSALAMAPDRGFIGENSIVGAGAPIACGVAMAQQRHGRGGVTLVSFGDGAMSQGALHEAMVFATAYRLPLIFILENNDWSEMTRTSSLTPLDRLARRAASYGMKGATIDGTDPRTVADAVRIAVDAARGGGGPALLEFRAPRLWGHYNRDIEHYRPKADRAEAMMRDPLALLEAKFAQTGEQAALDAIRVENERLMADVVKRVANAAAPDPTSAADHIVANSDTRTIALDTAADTTNANLTYVQAVNEALRVELEERPELLVYGEDCGHAGGIFGATRGLQKMVGAERVFDTPIAESAILGSAVGAAMSGLRPVVEIMWADFMLVALDQLINQAANVRYITQGKTQAPLVVRTQQGATPGSCAQHAQCLETLLAHIPGLKVGLPSTPQDAYDMLRAAIADPDPTIVIEARALYQVKGAVQTGGPIQPAGGARWRRAGEDLTIIATGTMVDQALAAAATLAAKGVEAGVLDLRWIAPLDDSALAEAVERGAGRVLIVHEANLSGGCGAEVAARIAERHAAALSAPPSRLGTKNSRIPAAPALQAALRPDAGAIAEAALMLVGKA